MPSGAGAGRPGAGDPSAALTADTMAGRWGTAVRQARADRDVIAAARGQRDPRTTLDVPDLLPTANELLDRVISLAPTLHGLDSALAPGVIESIELRIERSRAEPDGERKDRSLTMLQQQLATLNELVDRRAQLASKMEKALLALARLRYEARRLRGR